MIIDAGLNNRFLSFLIKFFLRRIYSAFIKTVDEQGQTSNWGKITNTGELLHEFQSGMFSKIFQTNVYYDIFRIGLDS